jgi:hypothetical protein
MQVHPGIRINRIPADGMGGLIFAVAMAALPLLAIPALRPIALLGLIGGAVLAPILHKIYY